MDLEIIEKKLLNAYSGAISKDLQQRFDVLEDAELSTPNFSFYTSVASVFSSKIEGENIELDSYIKHKRDGIPIQPDYTKKIDDLYRAYLFVQQNPLNEKNILEIHKLLSKHIVETSWQGKYRIKDMYVATDDGKIEYVAASPYILPTEIQKFNHDLNLLIKTTLDIETVFYYAAMLHLVFIKIHPWNDGNGRSARLIEKWFIAQKLGEKAWFIQSEKMYYAHHKEYYNNLRQPGLEYEFLDYSKALPFLMMLPKSLK